MTNQLFNVFVANTLFVSKTGLSAFDCQVAQRTARGLALEGKHNVMVKRVETATKPAPKPTSNRATIIACASVSPYSNRHSTMLYSVLVDGIIVTEHNAKGKDVLGYALEQANAIAAEYAKDGGKVEVVRSENNRRYYKYAVDEPSVSVDLQSMADERSVAACNIF